jgi:hypothetical protein
MKDFFDLKVFITVMICLIVFAVLNKLFLDEQLQKMASHFEKDSYENEEED